MREVLTIIFVYRYKIIKAIKSDKNYGYNYGFCYGFTMGDIP